MAKIVRKALAVFLILLLTPIFATADEFRGKWWHYYERGVDYSDRGELEKSLSDLTKAGKMRDKDQRMARTYGMHFIDYFPHRELGIVHFNKGNIETAIKELEESIRSVESSRAVFYLNLARKSQISGKKEIPPTPPKIVFENPTGSVITRNHTIQVRAKVSGAAYISRITVNGIDYRVEKAEKQIDVRQEITLGDDLTGIKIVAEDLLGNRVEQEVPITVKRNGPTIAISGISTEQRDGKRFTRVGGEVTDDLGVQAVRIGTLDKNTDGVHSYSFDLLVERTGDAALVIRAVDSIGNDTLAEVDLSRIIAEEVAEETALSRAADEKVEQESLALAEAERQRVVAAQEQAELLRIAKEAEERVLQARKEEERLHQIKAKAEQEKLLLAEEERKRIAAEKERLEQLAAEQERVGKEQAELARLKQEEAERQRQAAELEQRLREKAEQERIALEKAESERIAQEQAEIERLAREAREAVERRRVEWERAEIERMSRAAEEQQRMAARKAEEEQLASAKKAEELFAARKAEEEARAKRALEQLASDARERESQEAGRSKAVTAPPIIVERQKLKAVVDEIKLSQALSTDGDKQLSTGLLIAGGGTKAYTPPARLPVATQAKTAVPARVNKNACRKRTAEKPVITIKDASSVPFVFVDAYPLDGEAFDNCGVERVVVNGLDIPIRKGMQVYFSRIVKLESGENSITVDVFNVFGNKTTSRTNVTRKIPSVHLNSSRMSVLVLPFDFENRVGTPIQLAGDYLAGAMAEQKRFQVVERKKLKQLIEEQKMTQALAQDTDKVAELGKIVAAEAIVASTVRETDKSFEVTSRIINTETSEIMEVLDVYTEDKRPLVVKELMIALAAKIARSFPVVEGIVISRDDDKVMTDIGSPLKVRQRTGAIIYRKGNEIKHPQTGRSLGFDTVKLGEGYLHDVQENFSKMQLGGRFREQPIAPNDLVLTK